MYCIIYNCIYTVANLHENDPHEYDKYSCVLFVLMSYGEEGAFLCAGDTDEELISLSELTDFFVGKWMLKPKIFLIQVKYLILYESSCNMFPFLIRK